MLGMKPKSAHIAVESYSAQSSSAHALRFINNDRDLSPEHHTRENEHGFSDALDISDPRWILATRSQLILQQGGRIQSLGPIHDLIDLGTRLGFSEFASRAIIAIVEEAQVRGGLDTIAKNELLQIPRPSFDDHELSHQAKSMVFGLLFGWALLIAGIMQMV